MAKLGVEIPVSLSMSQIFCLYELRVRLSDVEGERPHCSFVSFRKL